MENSLEPLKYNQQLFEKAVSRAQKALKNGKLNSAVVWSQIGAGFAWSRHPGFYTSSKLESILLEIANRLDYTNLSVDLQIPTSIDASQRKKVLHVMTEALSFGGHTRVVTEWIKNTSDNCVHGVVTTSQQKSIPQDLALALKSNEGWCESLLDYSTDILTRSCILRQLARKWADIVVLHIHPSDALSVVAFGVSGGPPVIFFNHAGHSFWLGSSVADVVADILPWQQEITLDRHGVKNSRILPIPIPRIYPVTDHKTAKEQLGLKNETIVLLTMGLEYKYSSFGGYDFVDTMARILKRNPQVVLFAVGPRNHGKWAEASAAVGGRIKAMGLIDATKLSRFYDAADIYVDSFPLAGGISLLEAGDLGIPIIGLKEKEAPNINLSQDVALEKYNLFAPTTEAFTESLEKMIAEPSVLRQKAAEIKASIEMIHCAPGWNSFLGEVIQSLPLKHSVKLAEPTVLSPDLAEVFLENFQTACLFGMDAQNYFGVKVLKNLKYLTTEEKIRSVPDIIPRIKNIQTLKTSVRLLKEGLNL
jgi:hypothetical protein